MRTLLRSNPLRLAVLLWFAGWLLLVMPGHKRGIVTLPGAEAAQPSCCEPKPPSCCDTAAASTSPDCDTDRAAGSDCDTDNSTDTDPRPTDPAKHCAICFLKAHLTDPPPLTLYTPYLGELDELAYLTESSISQGQAAPHQLRGRAPPA